MGRGFTFWFGFIIVLWCSFSFLRFDSNHCYFRHCAVRFSSKIEVYQEQPGATCSGWCLSQPARPRCAPNKPRQFSVFVMLELLRLIPRSAVPFWTKERSIRSRHLGLDRDRMSPGRHIGDHSQQASRFPRLFFSYCPA